MKRWRYAPEARAEVVEAARYYGEQRSALADEFFEALEQTEAVIEEAPERATRPWQAPRELGLLCARMRRFPYRIVFIEEATGYYVVAVTHLRRKPLYWLERVPRR
jgi:plasmid stabilization system protein ParE